MVILYAITGYFAAGLLFAIPFLIGGVGVLDETAEESPWTFRLMIFPGCVAFWPILLKKYIQAQKYGRHD